MPSLLPLLHDADAGVREETVFALGQIGHRSARAALDSLLGRADVETALLAVEALGKIGDKAATPRIVSLLDHAAPRVRAEAAMSLWRLADSTALDPLLQHLDDRDAEVRWRALYALEKIVAPDRVVLAVALHLDDPEWLSRAYAVRTLGRQKSPRATAYVLQKVTDPEVGVAVNAIRALQGIADSTCRTCAGVLTAALRTGHPYVRLSAATALQDRFAWVAADSLARVNANGALVDAVTRDGVAAVRGAAARALLARRGAAALDDVRPVLADSSTYARVAAIQALALLPAGVAVPLLEARLAARTPLFERMTAAEALGTLHARGSAKRLRAALADTSTLWVAAAASALAEMGDTASVPLLARAWVARAADADADARLSIRDALRSLAGARYADSLERRHPAGAGRKPVYDDAFFAPPRAKGALLHTTAGDIEWAFASAEAPQTVKNFVRLAERGYFDGLRVHRVVPNFVIQDGDPTGTGSGGPGHTIRCEYNRLRYGPGMVGMALSGKDTGGSQWFITHSPQPHLNGRYTIFARVTRGMDVVHRIVQGDRVTKVEILR